MLEQTIVSLSRSLHQRTHSRTMLRSANTCFHTSLMCGFESVFQSRGSDKTTQMLRNAAIYIMMLSIVLEVNFTYKYMAQNMKLHFKHELQTSRWIVWGWGDGGSYRNFLLSLASYVRCSCI